jgi:hypothetical protein
MAIARPQARCEKCGKPYKALHRDMGKHFIGDTFVGWDVSGHKCDENSAKYKQWIAEREAYSNSPEGKQNAKEWHDIFDGMRRKQEKLESKKKQAESEKNDMEKFNYYLRVVADNPSNNICRKILAIKKFAEALAAKNVKDEK